MAEVGGVEAFIAIGSNLNSPCERVSLAIQDVAALDKIELLQASKLYETKPVGFAEQPNFINAVIKVFTTLLPQELMQQLLSIEHKHGRIRTTEKNGPRTLDLDILLYGSLQINSEYLTIPHPRMWEREFVLRPLFEIAPDLVVPWRKLSNEVA